MSTNFYEIRSPWTEVRCQDDGPHCRIDLWQDHAHAGTLTVSSKAKMEALVTFFESDRYEFKQVSHDGRIVLIAPRTPRGNCLLSEYGDLVSFSKLRKECDEVVEQLAAAA